MSLNQANYSPSLMADPRTSRAWLANGTTDTVTDGQCRASSVIVIMNTSARAGRWFITPSAGSFLITSSDAETETTTTFKYLIL